MSKETGYPLYPALTEGGAEEAQLLIAKFKEALKKAADEVINDLYVDVLPHIESDSWTNFRNDLLDGFQDYNNRRIQGAYDFKKIRQKIYKEYRAEIIDDLNQDLVEENKELKERLEWYQNERRRF